MSGKPQQTWVCDVCGYEHVGDHPPDECPVCGVGPDEFTLKESTAADETAAAPVTTAAGNDDPLAEYLKEWSRDSDEFETRYARIAHLARTGASTSSPMRTQRKFPDWDSVLFRGAQLDPMPLNGDVPVSTRTVIGPQCAHPLEMELPFYVSHMSYGALSREAKIALARGSKEVGIAACSGEGGMLPDEQAAAGSYIYELGTADFSHREENIKLADAIEIKIGQAAKPGLGGTLPRTKITGEIAAIRGIPVDRDSHSPGRHTGIDSPGDLKRRVAKLREMTRGRPVGVKITAGRIEADLAVVVAAAPDFLTIDCRGGGTGSGPDFVKDNVCLPPVFALHRARKFLDQAGNKATLCITGGFRDSTDIAKALAMGADAVALATSSMIAVGCQQYRICDTGRCPVGIATQDPELRKRFDIDLSVRRFVNFAKGTGRELEVLARINGHDDLHGLNVGDLLTLEHEISLYTNIEHA
ncbi:MAG: glutamate synthase-related protein [Candidatus Krumholzibacteriota bacterium]